MNYEEAGTRFPDTTSTPERAVEKSDAEIISEILSGRPDVFSILVQRYQNRLFGLLFHMVHNREEAEDLLQETLATCFVKLKQFEGRSSFYTWVCRVAVNLSISKRRKKTLDRTMSRSSLDEAEPSSEASDGAEQRMIQSERAHRVQQALSQLDEERRTIVLLRDFQNMDYDAIAEVLDIPIGTVRSRLHRARLDLREMLADLVEQ